MTADEARLVNRFPLPAATRTEIIPRASSSVLRTNERAARPRSTPSDLFPPSILPHHFIPVGGSRMDLINCLL